MKRIQKIGSTCAIRCLMNHLLILILLATLCESKDLLAKTPAEIAMGEFRESVSVCKAISQKLEGQHDLSRQIIDSRDMDERNALLLEKANVDAGLSRRYKRQSLRNGVYLGNSFHGWPLSYGVRSSDGLYCGVGTRYLKEAEKAGPTELSWLMREIYLDAFYKYTSLPWLECCMDVSQEEFLKMVKDASMLYREPALKAKLQEWAAGIERKTLRDMEVAMKNMKKSTEYPPANRQHVKRETLKFLSMLKRQVE